MGREWVRCTTERIWTHTSKSSLTTASGFGSMFPPKKFARRSDHNAEASDIGTRWKKQQAAKIADGRREAMENENPDPVRVLYQRQPNAAEYEESDVSSDEEFDELQMDVE